MVPGKFKGEQLDARQFITAISLYFKGNARAYDTEYKKLSLVYSLMEGKAGQWIKPYMSNHLDQHTNELDQGDDLFKDKYDNDYVINDFEGFCVVFEETWFSQDEAADARAKIEKISQGQKRVTDYSTEFQFIAAQTAPTPAPMMVNASIMTCYNCMVATTANRPSSLPGSMWLISQNGLLHPTLRHLHQRKRSRLLHCLIPDPTQRMRSSLRTWI